VGELGWAQPVIDFSHVEGLQQKPMGPSAQLSPALDTGEKKIIQKFGQQPMNLTVLKPKSFKYIIYIEKKLLSKNSEKAVPLFSCHGGRGWSRVQRSADRWLPIFSNLKRTYCAYAHSVRSHLVIARPFHAISLSHGQGRALTYNFVVEKPRNNFIVRIWWHNKVIARFSCKSDLTEYVSLSFPLKLERLYCVFIQYRTGP
jgi:hypothetical protein